MKTFNQNADSFETPLQKVQRKVDNFIAVFLSSLEKKDGNITPSVENLIKISKFERELKRFIKNSGYEGLVQNFLSETPKLIKKTI